MPEVPVGFVPLSALSGIPEVPVGFAEILTKVPTPWCHRGDTVVTVAEPPGHCRTGGLGTALLQQEWGWVGCGDVGWEFVGKGVWTCPHPAVRWVLGSGRCLPSQSSLKVSCRSVLIAMLIANGMLMRRLLCAGRAEGSAPRWHSGEELAQRSLRLGTNCLQWF